MNNCFAEYDFTELNKIESEKEYFEALKKVFYEEYKDGKNYLVDVTNTENFSGGLFLIIQKMRLWI